MLHPHCDSTCLRLRAPILRRSAVAADLRSPMRRRREPDAHFHWYGGVLDRRRATPELSSGRAPSEEMVAGSGPGPSVRSGSDQGSVLQLDISTLPGVCLKGCFERSLGDAAGVIRDCGRGDDGNDFQGMILAKTRRDKLLNILITETSALFDHRSCQGCQ